MDVAGGEEGVEEEEQEKEGEEEREEVGMVVRLQPLKAEVKR